MQVVILAGGKGTRLGALAAATPKPLVEIAGQPILLHQLNVVRRYGYKRVLILTGHLGERISAYFGDGRALDLELRYVQEELPLGTAGALRAAEAHLEENFFLFYGDIIFDVDLPKLQTFHAASNAAATLVVHPNDHPHDSDLVEVGSDGRVRALHDKHRDPSAVCQNLVNTGLYCMSRAILRAIPPRETLDFGLHIFPRLLKRGEPLAAYRTPEYIKDVGTPGRLRHVEQDIIAGRVAARNLSLERGAIFLDRDGTINVEMGDRYAAMDLELLPGAAAAVRRINGSDFLAIGITNQPGIAKGFMAESDVDLAHAKMDGLLAAEGAYLDDILVCPHHPERGFSGERIDLKIACDCRKPQPGLILKAAARYNIDVARSFMVGDRTADLLAGVRAGAYAVLVNTGYAGSDGKFAVVPDFVCEDLDAAVSLILDHGHMLGPAETIGRTVAGMAAAAPHRMVLVAIGGLAHSGKSTFAKLLRRQLERRHVAASIAPFGAQLMGGEEERAGGVLIVDGVPSLGAGEWGARADIAVAVRIDEYVRRNRFVADEVRRGRSESEAIALYEYRHAEEKRAEEGFSLSAHYIVSAGENPGFFNPANGTGAGHSNGPASA